MEENGNIKYIIEPILFNEKIGLDIRNSINYDNNLLYLK